MLQAKRIKERVKLKEVAKLEMELNKLRDALEAIRSRYRDTIQSIITQRLGNSSSIELKRTLAYRERLTSNETAQLFQIQSADKNMEEIKKELLTANMERKMIEKLKEKKIHEYKKKYLKSEQIITDDISVRNRGSVFPFQTVIEESIA